MHVDSFIDNNVLYFAHLYEACVLSARGITRGQLNTQGTNHKQGLVVYLHKVNVKHHSNQGNDYGAGQYCSVIGEEEHGVGKNPHEAGAHHHLTDGDFRGANSELRAET